MQHQGDVVFQKALDNPDRRWKLTLQFDWNGNGLFDHAYSDMSSLLQTATRSGVITSNMPDKTNTITGASSSDVRLTLQGARTPGELDAFALFSEYRSDSPLAGKQIEGTKVRYIRTLYTSAGPSDTRQFTGKIRTMSTDQAGSRVQLVCQDNVDAAAASCTLPLWAVGYNTPFFEYPGVASGTDRPIEATWVVGEILRQAGSSIGPNPRPGCVSYQSCNGSFLPAFGYGTLVNAYNVKNYLQFISQEAADPWEAGLYGLAPARIPSVSPGPPHTVNAANFASQRYTYVPQEATGQGQVNITWSGWVKINGPGGATYGYTRQCMYLDDASPVDLIGIGDPAWGSVQVFIQESGNITFQANEGTLATGSPRTWFSSWSKPLLTGWHYFSARWRFTDSDVQIDGLVDGVTLGTPSSQDALSGVGFRHGPTPSQQMNNPIRFETNIPVQHQQWATGDSTLAAYYTNEQLPPLTDDGLSKAIVSRSVLKLSWIPNIVNSYCWTELNNMASAEFGAVFCNEFGQIVYMTHDDMGYSADFNIGNAPTLTTDNFSQFQMSPSLDQHRNTVSLSWTARHMEQAIVWQAQSARDHFASVGNEMHTDAVTLADTIAVYWKMTPFADYLPLSQAEIRIDISQASSTKYADPSLGAAAGWDVYVVPLPDQRTMQLSWHCGAANEDIYAGAFKDANQAAWFVAGKRYTAVQTFRKVTSNGTALAADGGMVRQIVIPDNPWVQDEFVADRLINQLLIDTINPYPVLENVAINADPRLQYVDIVKIVNPRALSGYIYAQVLGRGFSDSVSGGVRDDLTLRAIRSPGKWILGLPGRTELGSTTIL